MSSYINIKTPDFLQAQAQLKKLLPEKKELVILAIGSDRVIGDCVGPLVGDQLKACGYTVYGDLRSPVTANNVVQIHDLIKRRHPNAFILAIDSAIGDDCDIGKIKALPRGVYPAAASGKNLPRVGNASVIGIVSPKRQGALGLKYVRLHDILKICHAITQCIEDCKYSRTNISLA